MALNRRIAQVVEPDRYGAPRLPRLKPRGSDRLPRSGLRLRGANAPPFGAFSGGPATRRARSNAAPVAPSRGPAGPALRRGWGGGGGPDPRPRRRRRGPRTPS